MSSQQPDGMWVRSDVVMALEAEVATLRQERDLLWAKLREWTATAETSLRAAEAENARLRARVIQLEESMNPMDVPPEPAETDHE